MHETHEAAAWSLGRTQSRHFGSQALDGNLVRLLLLELRHLVYVDAPWGLDARLFLDKTFRWAVLEHFLSFMCSL